MRRRKTWIIVVAALLLAGGGGYLAYMRYFAVAEEPSEPTLETATVTQGDIVITADGSGELVPAAELELTFRASGVLGEMLVEVGDQVQKDDVLARLETDDLERAVAEADVEVQLAQFDLADVREGASDAELADAQAALRDTQVELELARDAYDTTSDSALDAAVESRKARFDWYVGYYQGQKAKSEAGDLSQSNLDHAMNAMISAEGKLDAATNQALAEEAQAKNRVDQAQNAAYQAWENLQLLQSGPLTDTLLRAELTVDQALLTRERARADLEAAQLYAPFDGTVMEVTASVGEHVGTSTPVLTLADLKEPLVRFWVEETDLSSVTVGNPVNIVFEALPDDTFTGEIIRVDPVLVTVDSTPAVQAWASLDLGYQETKLLSGMTAEVEVIAAEARNALLVPVEALRELSPGQYAVFVVKSDGAPDVSPGGAPSGELEMRPVTVGLTDPVNAEILAGLELGEVVSIE
jgi:HlyD family secretion protein